MTSTSSQKNAAVVVVVVVAIPLSWLLPLRVVLSSEYASKASAS